MPDFESFSLLIAASVPQLCVTLHSRGTMSLNRVAYTALGLPTAVELLFDSDADTLGLRPAAVNDGDVRRVRMTSPPNGPWVISARAFSRLHNIDTTISQRRTAYIRDDVLYVDLRVEGVPVTSNRAGRIAST